MILHEYTYAQRGVTGSENQCSAINSEKFDLVTYPQYYLSIVWDDW